MISEATKKLITGMMLGKIPEDRFLSEFGADKNTIHDRIRDLLKESRDQNDSKGVEMAQLLGHHFGFRNELLPILHDLAFAPWHKYHESTVDALEALKSPESVPVLAKMASIKYPYLEWDKSYSLNTKAVYALWRIRTPEAIRALGTLLSSENKVIRKTAKERLQDLARSGAPNPQAELAKQTLKAES